MSNPSSKPHFVRLDLSDEQKNQVRAETGAEAEAIELTAKELEERIAPRMALLEDRIAPRTMLSE